MWYIIIEESVIGSDNFENFVEYSKYPVKKKVSCNYNDYKVVCTWAKTGNLEKSKQTMEFGVLCFL